VKGRMPKSGVYSLLARGIRASQPCYAQINTLDKYALNAQRNYLSSEELRSVITSIQKLFEIQIEATAKSKIHEEKMPNKYSRSNSKQYNKQPNYRRIDDRFASCNLRSSLWEFVN
jgi:hypothetical protein